VRVAFDPRDRSRSGYTLDAMEVALRDCEAPAASAGLSAFEVFAGYLVLDALVANQDRHVQNWAVLRPLPGAGRIALAPSFDHGSSLAFNLTDHRRALLLDRDGVAAFCARARAQRFDAGGDGRLTLVTLAAKALDRCSEAARERWLEALGRLTDEQLTGAVTTVPELSDPVRSLTSAMLITNRRRLLDECDPAGG
jgi:hypothetical protein